MLQSGMIEGGAESCCRQVFRNLTGMKSAADIDDGRASDILQTADQFQVLVGRVANQISQVLALEGHAEDLKGLRFEI